jgi:hypothetical protein
MLNELNCVCCAATDIQHLVGDITVTFNSGCGDWGARHIASRDVVFQFKASCPGQSGVAPELERVVSAGGWEPAKFSGKQCCVCWYCFYVCFGLRCLSVYVAFAFALMVPLSFPPTPQASPRHTHTLHRGEI